MILNYRSGEEILAGDHVFFHRNPATIELVAVAPGNDQDQTSWYVQEYGGGIMIHDPMVSGHTFIPADQIAECEDLEFVSRASPKPK